MTLPNFQSIEGEERFRRLVEGVAVVGWELDLATFRFTYISPQAVPLFGYPLEAWGEDGFWAAHIHPDDQQETINECAIATARGEDHALEYRFLTADQRVVWVRDVISVQSDDTGPRTLHGFMVDITGQRNVEEALLATVNQLTLRSAELERVAYVASHDLQEPLRTITSFSQLLDRRFRNQLGDEGQEYLELVSGGARRMYALINDLLAYSRLSNDPEPFNLVSAQDMCATALENLRRSIEDSGATVEIGPLPELVASDIQMVQLFQNLIGNAIKFRRGEAPRVSVTAAREGDYWVADNGIGLAETDQDIFEIFRRLHPASVYPGTGVGLAVCKRIVQRHGGRIWVQSRHGVGSTFYFSLPVSA